MNEMKRVPGFIDQKHSLEHAGTGTKLEASRLLDVTDIEGTHVSVPAGYVLKEYKEEISKSFGENICDREQLENTLELLKTNWKLYDDFFKDKMPGFVLPTQLVIGKNNDEQIKIFEIQKDLSDYFYFSFDISVNHVIHDMKDYLGDSGMIQFMKEFDIFIALLEDMKKTGEYMNGYIPDVSLDNVCISPEGHFILFDTNAVSGLSYPNIGSIWFKYFSKTLSNMKMVRKYMNKLYSNLKPRVS
jgi:hypothetical protein